MSEAGTSRNMVENPFPAAKLQVRYSAKRRSKLKKVRVAVSQNVYWKEMNTVDNDKPLSLADFHDANTLEISRKKSGTSWEEVKEAVKAENYNDKPCVIVAGVLHGAVRRNKLVSGRNVEIVLIPESEEQRDKWVEQLRALVAPWEFLKQRMKKLVNRIQSYKSVDEISERVGGMVIRGGPSEDEISHAQSAVTDECIEKLAAFPEVLEKFDWVDKLNVHGTAFVNFATTIVKLAGKTEQITATAMIITDVSKCVTGASTLFQLFTLSAGLVARLAETERGRRDLPGLLNRVIVLLGHTLRSLVQMLNTSSNVEDFQVDFVFEVLKETVDVLGEMEKYLLSGRGRQFLSCKTVKEIESTMEELEVKVQVVTNSSNIHINRERIAKLETESISRFDGEHHVRPEPTPFFVGRTEELGKLRRTLEKRGSAVITQYGGAGKTELMIAFGEQVEEEEKVPGGVFWVTVDGEASDVVASLADFAENLTKKTILQKDRKNPKFVIAEMKRGLSKIDGRWLLCLDNADNNDIGGILDAVCSLADPSKENGWVLVTSRQGQPTLWDRMKEDQKVVLQPLSEEDSMVVLWRQIRVIEVREADDELVKKEIKKVEKDNGAEYKALKKLCDGKSAHSLGGLPLALIQAGTYIKRFKCSFVEYQKLLEEANEKKDLDDIFVKSQQLTTISEAQRSILTTWSVSVGRLTKKAYGILRALSLFGATPIPDELVRGVVEKVGEENESVERIVRNVLMGELVHGSSLVYGEERKEGYVFGMHRLVRRFVLAGMEQGSLEWNEAHRIALVSAHTQIGEALEKENRSFCDLPDMYDEPHRMYSSHTLALIERVAHFNCSFRRIHDSELRDIHWYTGIVLCFRGRAHEERRVWRFLMTILDQDHEKNKLELAKVMGRLGKTHERLGLFQEAESVYRKSLEMLQNIHGDNAEHPDIARSFNYLGNVCSVLGRLVEAEEMHRKCLRMRMNIYGDNADHPHIADSFNNLGVVCGDLGRHVEAEEMHRKCLRMRMNIYGGNADHPDIADSFNNLGLVCRDLGRLVEAEEMHRKCFGMRMNIYGDNADHPNIADSFNNLGLVCRELGRLVEAEEMHRKCLEMRMNIYGDNADHPNIAHSFNNLGLVCRDLGRLVEAEEMHRKCLRMRVNIYGDNADHPNIADSFNNLGNMCSVLGRHVEAEEMHRKCLGMRMNIYGDNADHPNIADSFYNLGVVCRNLGRLVEAEEMHRKCLRMRMNIYANDYVASLLAFRKTE